MAVPSSRARVLATALVISVMAAGCSSAPQATLDDTRGSNETAAAIQVLADTADAEALPTPSRPILLGLGDGSADRGGVPEILAFEGEEDGGPAGPAVPAVPTEVAVDPADEDDTNPVGDEPGEELDPTEVDESAPEPADDGSAPDPETAPDDEDDPAAAPPSLPPPPPAVAGPDAPYDDPSPVIVRASGRPFDPIGPGTTTRGVTDDTITVGGLASQTLAESPFRDAVCLGAEARFGQANHHGELTRTIDFTGCYDDAGQTELSDGLTRAIVRDGDFAMVPLASPSFFADTVLNEERLPAIGDERLPAFCGRTNPLGFGTRGAQGCPILDARGYLTLADPVLSAWSAAGLVERPWEAVTYVVPQGAGGETTAASRRFEAELLDVPTLTFLGALPAPGDATRSEWSTTVASILETDPDTVFLEHDAIEGLPAALRAEGFDGHLVVVGAIDPLDVADDEWRAAMAPLTVISLGDDLASRTSRGWSAIVGAAAAIGVEPDDIGRDFVEGYLAADFLVRAVGATPEPLSVEAMADTVNAGWWYPGVDGVSCGSWWPASHFIVTPCVSVATVEVFSPRLVPVLGLVETQPQVAFNLGE